MRKTGKKALSLLLALVLVLAMLPPAALAADSDFVIENGVLTNYNGPGGAVTIPAGVTEIGHSAFSNCTGLTSVTIPDSVTSIGTFAFRDCTGLTNVAIPNSVTKIESDAFEGCTSLTSVTIPDGVSEIGYTPFLGCTGLTDIRVDTGNQTFSSVDGVLFADGGKTLHTYPAGKHGAYAIPNGVTSIKRCAFVGCTGLTSVTIPGSVTSIESYAFEDCTSLTSVTIPDGVSEIGYTPFFGCTGLTDIRVDAGNQNYTSVDGVLFADGGKMLLTYPAGKHGVYAIPDGVTSIRLYAFGLCTGLTGVTIPGSVTSIGGSAFYKCTGLTSVTIPGSVTKIEAYAFEDCTSLTSVTIPGSVAEIVGMAFLGCTSLSGIRVDAGNQTFTSVDGVLFADSGKTLHTYPAGKYGAYAIPDGVTSIGPYAFGLCTGLTSVTIPNSVTSIEGSAFSNCTALTSVTIPISVAQIGVKALDGCTALTDVYYGGNKEQWAAIRIDIYNTPLTNATIHYNSTAPDQPTVPTVIQAVPTNDTLTINGKPATPAAYKINGTNYFKLRDVAALITGTRCQFDVGWDGATRSATITTGKPYAKLPTDLQGKPTAGCTAELSSDVVYVNGEKANLTVYKINGANYFKLRDLGTLLDFYVGYDNGTMLIDTSRSYDVNS